MIPETPTAEEWRDMVDHQRAKACGFYHQVLLTLVGFAVLFGYSFVACFVRALYAVVLTLADVRATAADVLEHVWG